MFRLNFEISWPVKHKQATEFGFGDFCRTFKLSERKYFEIQAVKFDHEFTLLKFDLNVSIWGHDHAGVNLEVALFNYTLILNLYDNRHWNYEENRWMTDAEIKADEEEYYAKHPLTEEEQQWLNDPPRGKEMI